MDNNVTSREYGIDLFKFLISIFMVYYHYTPLLSGVLINAPLLDAMTTRNCRVGSPGVMCFFIVSGYLFSKRSEWQKSPYKFALDKFARLWPALAFSLLVNFRNVSDFLNLLFISSGLGVMKYASSNPALWYVCDLFWLLIIFYLFFKAEEKEFRRYGWVLIFLIVGMSLIAQNGTGAYCFLNSDQIPFLTNGALLGITGISCGIICHFASSFLQRKIKTARWTRICGGAVFFTCVVFLSLALIYLNRNYEMVFYAVVASSIIISGKACNSCFPTPVRKTFEFFGNISYAIYVMQFPCFYYLKKMIQRGVFNGFSEYQLLSLCMIVCVLAGLFVHYCVERPSKKLIMSIGLRTNMASLEGK